MLIMKHVHHQTAEMEGENLQIMHKSTPIDTKLTFTTL